MHIYCYNTFKVIRQKNTFYLYTQTYSTLTLKVPFVRLSLKLVSQRLIKSLLSCYTIYHLQESIRMHTFALISGITYFVYKRAVY